MTAGKHKYPPITLSLGERSTRILKDLAKAAGLTVSEYLRRLLDAEMKREKRRQS